MVPKTMEKTIKVLVIGFVIVHIQPPSFNATLR
jgi:hypothetical protein